MVVTQCMVVTGTELDLNNALKQVYVMGAVYKELLTNGFQSYIIIYEIDLPETTENLSVSTWETIKKKLGL